VQLKHDPKETTWEKHGHVILKLDGKVIAEDPKFQHNRSCNNRHSSTLKLVDAVTKAVAF